MKVAAVVAAKPATKARGSFEFRFDNLKIEELPFIEFDQNFPHLSSVH